jgi:hypothetical protein
MALRTFAMQALPDERQVMGSGRLSAGCAPSKLVLLAVYASS